MSLEGFVEREKARRKEDIFQAYLISRWVWQKKINIKKILQTDEKKKSMTDAEMLERVKMLNAVFGGETKRDIEKQVLHTPNN